MGRGDTHYFISTLHDIIGLKLITDNSALITVTELQMMSAEV
jgi:hypothetical protein